MSRRIYESESKADAGCEKEAPDDSNPSLVPSALKRQLRERRERTIRELAELTRIIDSLPEFVDITVEGAYYRYLTEYSGLGGATIGPF